jgi:hypothetical protein
MRSSASPLRRRAFLITVSTVTAIGLALIGFGVYGLVGGPAAPSSPPAPSPSGTATIMPGTPGPTSPAHAASLPKTDNPEDYARAVAKALFTWDTMSGLTLQDYQDAVVAGADPTGSETAGLVSDLAAYLPTDEVWQQLRTYQTAQSLTIDSAKIPTSWPGIVASSGSELERGTVAVTITGTRHRSGTWEGQPQHTESPVSFTVFEVCEPAYEQCHVLRLSQLNDPLK